jgi:hypothetical protein
MNTSLNRLARIFEVILEEARNDPDFAAKLNIVLGTESPRRATGAEPANPSLRRSNRRAKAVVDPFKLLMAGEDNLRKELGKLNLEQLKDVVAEYGMDSSKLALKWKSRERLADFIITTVVARNRKGDAFRDSSTGTTSEPTSMGDGGSPTPNS